VREVLAKHLIEYFAYPVDSFRLKDHIGWCIIFGKDIAAEHSDTRGHEHLTIIITGDSQTIDGAKHVDIDR
jgi:hypothetical protein